MHTATWNDVVIAKANDDEVEIVEGNVYFPLSAVNRDLLSPSDKVTTCPWKGSANYYNVEAGGKTNPDAAWTYRTPLDAAKHIKDRIAFWRGVKIE
jgi:uncharacterized protein (DUF427 family)